MVLKGNTWNGLIAKGGLDKASVQFSFNGKQQIAQEEKGGRGGGGNSLVSMSTHREKERTKSQTSPLPLKQENFKVNSAFSSG